MDKYLTVEEILATKYRIEWEEKYNRWLQFFIEGGKKTLVSSYFSDGEMEKFSDEDAMMHWIMLGRTWDDSDLFGREEEEKRMVQKFRSYDE